MSILSDYKWASSDGHLFGVFVYAKGNLLSGIEVWLIDGQATPVTLPVIEAVRPIGTPSPDK